MSDYFGFTMAALNDLGSVFANACNGDKNMSTLMYRPFGSWASNSEWSMRYEGEEVKALALVAGWVVAVTSLKFLRIFTEGGLQGVPRVNQRIEVCPCIVMKDECGNVKCTPIYSRIVSMYAEQNELQFVVPGGLIGVGTTMDPTLTCADKLVG